MQSATNGYSNTAIGLSALDYLTSGNNNTCVGAEACGGTSGYVLTTGSYNTIVGSGASLLGLTTGNYNTIIGAQVSGLSPTLSNNIIIADGAGNQRINVDNTGNVGIGTTSPTTALQVNGVIAPNADNTSSLGNATYRWASVFAANGTIQTSDRRLKSNITDLNYGLSDLLKLRPVSFTWIAQPQQGTQLGFIAQEVQPIFPETVNVGDGANHTLGLTYTEFIPVIVKSIQQLAQEFDGLAESFASNRITANNELCVGGTCVTPQQFQTMVAATNASPESSFNSSPDASNDASTTPDTPPTIQINGDNPAYIIVGAVYSDLGATIIAPQADLNLGIKTFLNGALVSNISIDTSAVATDTVDYVATDNAGNTATSTRAVIIQSVSAPSDATTTMQ